MENMANSALTAKAGALALSGRQNEFDSLNRISTVNFQTKKTVPN